jgi:minor tail protein
MGFNQRIGVQFVAYGGNVNQMFAGLNGSIMNTGRVASQANRQFGMFNRTLQAVRTTARYAFAGSIVFGTVNAIRSLAQFQSQLGDINAILGTSEERINRLGDALINVSTRTVTPVGELQDSVRNIVSTMGEDLTNPQLQQWSELFSKGARVAETDAYNFGNTIMGMRNAFGMSTKDMEGIANEFYATIKLSAGTTGDEWAKFSGRLVAGASNAGVSLEEMNAMFVLMSRQGGTAATNIRHLSQLLMNIRNPGASHQKFWDQLGLTKTAMANMSGKEILEKLMGGVRARGGVTTRRVTEDQLALMEEQVPGSTGIGGPASIMLSNLFGRMESRRAFAVLFNQWENMDKNAPGFAQTLQRLNESFNNTGQGVNTVQEAFEKWLKRNQMQQAATAVGNLSLKILNNFTPAFNIMSGAITKFSNWLGGKGGGKIKDFFGGLIPDSGRGRAAMGIGAGVGLGALGVGVLLSRRLRGMARFGIGGAITAQTAENLVTGVANGTMTAPFWVIIHPSSNILGAKMGGSPTGPLSGTSWLDKLKKWGTRAAGVAGAAAGAGKYVFRGGRWILRGSAAAGFGFGAVPDELDPKDVWPDRKPEGRSNWKKFADFMGFFDKNTTRRPGLERALQQREHIEMKRHGLAIERQRKQTPTKMTFEANAEARRILQLFDISLTTPDGRVKIPTKRWPNPPPRSRGQKNAGNRGSP